LTVVYSGSVEGPDGKLWRAKQYLVDLREEVPRRRGITPHTITVEDNPDASEYIFEVFGLQETDPTWGYQFGDCIHNARSALDHLVYQLAVLNLGRDLTEKEARSCQFPVFDNPDYFKDTGVANIRLLRVGERTRITELQPFNAGDGSIWGNTPFVNFRMHPAPQPTMLQRVVDLDNIDKHRLVHPTWYAARWIGGDPVPAPFEPYSINHGRLEDGAELGRWRYPKPRPELPAEMDMNRYFPIGISLGEPFMFDAIELLGWCIETVEWVIGLFRPCFADGSVSLPVTTL
jgi:hypothetical protein